TLKEQREALVKEANDLVAERKSKNADLSSEDRTRLQDIVDQVKGIDAKTANIAKDTELKDAISGLGAPDGGQELPGDGSGSGAKAPQAKSMGDHFIKSVGENVSVLGMRG